MKYKQIDPNAPRCPTCNEILLKADLKNLKRQGNVCNWCAGFRSTYTSHCPRYERDMSDWLNELRLDDLPIRNPGTRVTGSDLRREELK